MGRRNSPVILSSSDDDQDNGNTFRSTRLYTKRKSKQLITRTNPKQSKRPRVSGSRSHFSRESSSADAVRFPSEGFEELFCASKVSTDFYVREADWKEMRDPGPERRNVEELWVDKYRPCSLEELAVHKKKVEEVKLWFEERLKAPKENFRNHVLIISGQAGVGKSVTIHAIASHFGAKLCEWNTPTPTIWQEHVHNANTGIPYTSKLDEFVNFIERVRKYGLIPPNFSGESKTSIILLIDDIPLTNGRVAFERLQNCLLLLVRSTQVPTAILVTECGKGDSTDHNARYLEELQSSLENAGACKVPFNPITNNSIKKTLLRICRQEQCNVTAEQIDLIAQSSGGDIRHAITSLQLFCVKADPVLNLSSCNSTWSYADGNANEINSLVRGFSSLFGRDETLSLFHALGKFLHNKREAESVTEADQGAMLVREKFSRLPLKMEAPEKILSQAHGQARPVTDFLHENVLDFLSKEAMDDAWDVVSYLGDADLLLSSFRGTLIRYDESENILQSAAASVACRGVLFGNLHPLSSRWHAIRRPKLWQVEQSLLHNQKEMVRQRFIAYNASSSSHLSDIATEFTPSLKWLGYRASGFGTNQEHVPHNATCGESFGTMSLADEDDEISDDEIEDW